jgi:hypothetical protein
VESAFSIGSAIDPKEFVFNVDLAVECLLCLQNAASQNPNIILHLESSNKKYSWQGWMQTVATTATTADVQPQSDAACQPLLELARSILTMSGSCEKRSFPNYATPECRRRCRRPRQHPRQEGVAAAAIIDSLDATRSRIRGVKSRYKTRA